jgi:hypothetical protein
MQTKTLVFLLAIFTLAGSASALYYSTWVDSFTTTDYIGSSNNLNISTTGGNVSLNGGQSRGNLTSVAINGYALHSWDLFYANNNRAGDANISFWIYNSTGISGCYGSNILQLNETPDTYLCVNVSGTGLINCSLAFDKNVSTYLTSCGEVDGYIYTNFTIPLHNKISILTAKLNYTTYLEDEETGNIESYCYNGATWILVGIPLLSGLQNNIFDIPNNCLTSTILQIRLNYNDHVGESDCSIPYVTEQTELRETQIYWNITSPINSSQASSGFNLSSCLGSTTPIYLFADFQGNNTNPALLDWNVTYYQSESSCFDYDGGINPNIGSNVTKVGFTYKDSCSGSTLTEYYCDSGIIKTSTYTCPQVCQDTTRCRGDCIGNVSAWSYYIATNSSTTQYILFNLTLVDNIKLNASNVISLKQSWQRSGREFIVNATGNANTVIYLSDDVTNLAYPLSSPTPNLTLQLTLSNFTRINPYYNISFGIEENWSQMFSNDLVFGHKLYVYCGSSGTFYKDIKLANITSLIIAPSETPQNFLSSIDWDGVNKYTRSYVPYADTENITMYLIDLRNNTVVAVTFNLIDLSYSFDNAIIRLQKYVDGTLKDMHSDYFDATDTALAYLLDNGKYIITISSGTTTNSFGWVTVTQADTTKTVVVSAVFQSGKMISPYDFIGLKVDANYSTGQICLHYNDSTAKTTYVTFFISNASNTQLYNVTTTASVATLCYTVPVLNATYLWRVQISHPDGSVWEVGEWIDMLTGIIRKLAPLESHGVTEVMGFSVSDVYKYAALIGVIGMSCLAGALDFSIGAWLCALSVTFFSFIGWISLSPITGIFIIVLAVAGSLHKGQNA